MNLDDLNHLREVDPQDMLARIDALPDQIVQAWELSQTLPLPISHRSPKQIVVCGMGGSAIGGDLAAALIGATSPVGLHVVRGYKLPAYVAGPDSLVIASSYSGNTEETLAAAEEALQRGTRLLAITTGGTLAEHASANDYPLWQFSYEGQPRAAVGWSFGLLIGLASRLNLALALENDLREAVDVLHEHRENYQASTPLPANTAKRGAGQLIGRIPVVYGGGVFEPVARRWKTQLNENAKVWAQFEPMPEANHNTIVGISFPDALMHTMQAIFITSPQLDHPRVRLRHDLTYTLCLENGIMCDKFMPRGSSPLAQMLHAIQYGDYLSYYTAIAYGVDPTPVAPIAELKTLMAQAN